MKIKENITIDRAKEIVWEHIHDPRYMVKWNPKIKALKPMPNELPGVGYKYDIEYKMLGKPDKFAAEIIEYNKNDFITIRLSFMNNKYAGFILEKFILRETKNGTRLNHYLDIAGIKINFLLKCLLLLLGFFIKPIGRKHLKVLKKSVEC